MPLKTSFFNPTLFKKNLTRSWPMWGGVAAVGSLLPLYLLLALNSNEYVHFEREEFVEFLYSAAVYFLPAFTACYAILVAMFVWSYLHNSRSAGFMHSLAIDRTGLFVTNTLSGFAMLLIPYVIVGGLFCVIAVCYGAMDIGAVLLTVAAVILENLLFFGMGTLCASVTGSVIATAAYYVILNFAVPVLDALVNMLAQEFIFGLTYSSSEPAILLSPLISLYEHVEVFYRTENGVRADIPEIAGFGFIVVYGVAGIIMLAASWLLYRRRRSESAGDVVAFRWLRPVFRFGIAIISAMTLGWVLYELFWASLFGVGRYADMIPMAVCMMIGAVVGYYAASMLLEKSLRVFKGSLKGVGIVCAATVVLFFAVALDLFGVEKYVPDVEDIKTVDISGYLDITCSAEQMPELCAEIVALHEAIIADKTHIYNFDYREWTDEDVYSWRTVYFSYTLKNGSRVERAYSLPLAKIRMQDADTYDGKLYALATNPEVLIASVTVPESAEIVSVYLEGYRVEEDVWETNELYKADWTVIYEALQRDAREGNFISGSGDFFWDWTEEQAKVGETFVRDAWLYVDYRVAVYEDYPDYRRYGNIAIQLQPSMKHTLNALISVGALDQMTLDYWRGNTYTITATAG